MTNPGWCPSLRRWGRTRPPFGESVNAIVSSGCQLHYTMPPVRDARPFFSRSERQAIEGLACDEPASVGRGLTHWSLRSLAQAAVEAGLVGAIFHAPVNALLRQADLHL